jgi:hypothetical protein
MERNHLCKRALEGDRGSFKVFQILAQSKSFSHNSKVRLYSIVRRDGSSRIRLAIQIPGVRIGGGQGEKSHPSAEMASGVTKGTMNRSVPSTGEFGRSCLALLPGQVSVRRRRGRSVRSGDT